MDYRPRLFELLDPLVDRWCQRRERAVLSELVPAYVAFDRAEDPRSNPWLAAVDAILRARNYRARLPAEEVDMLNEAFEFCVAVMKWAEAERAQSGE
jgi:hypothetical protein